jgi:predicted RNase H-related nuclease YkuK (DUF458 family)
MYLANCVNGVGESVCVRYAIILKEFISEYKNNRYFKLLAICSNNLRHATVFVYASDVIHLIEQTGIKLPYFLTMASQSFTA